MCAAPANPPPAAGQIQVDVQAPAAGPAQAPRQPQDSGMLHAANAAKQVAANLTGAQIGVSATSSAPIDAARVTVDNAADGKRGQQNANIQSIASTIGLLAGIALIFCSFFFPPLMLLGLPLALASFGLSAVAALKEQKQAEKMQTEQRRQADLNTPAETLLNEIKDDIIKLHEKIDGNVNKLNEITDKINNKSIELKQLELNRDNVVNDSDKAKLNKKINELKIEKKRLQEQEQELSKIIKSQLNMVETKKKYFDRFKNDQLNELNKKILGNKDKIDEIVAERKELNNCLGKIQQRLSTGPAPSQQEREDLAKEEIRIRSQIQELYEKFTDLQNENAQLSQKINDLSEIQAEVKPQTVDPNPAPAGPAVAGGAPNPAAPPPPIN